jgi:hypothetical protein
MSDASTPRSPALRRNVVAHLVGAFAVGCFVLAVPFSVSSGLPQLYASINIVDVTPELLLLVAVGLALVPALRRFAWLIAAIGLLGEAVVLHQTAPPEVSRVVALLAISAGLQLAGVLLALADAARPERLAIAIGFGAGATAGKYALPLVIRAVSDRAIAESFLVDSTILSAVVVLAAAGAGLVVLLSPRTKGVEPRPTAPWGPLVWVTAAAVVAVVFSQLWQLALEDVGQASTGGMGQQRAEFIDSLDSLVRVTTAVVVVLILMYAAYRRGGANLARWVVVAFGLAATSLTIPFVFFGPNAGQMDELDVFVRVVFPAVIGAVAGAAAVSYVDRWFPWDALGIVLGAAAMLLISGQAQRELPDLTVPALVLGSFGLGLALSAGLARLADPGARGLSTPEVSMSAGFGVAALVLCQHVIAPFTYVMRQDATGPQLTLPLTMVGAAVVLVVLFGLERLVQRIRTDPVAEAAAGQG